MLRQFPHSSWTQFRTESFSRRNLDSLSLQLQIKVALERGLNLFSRDSSQMVRAYGSSFKIQKTKLTHGSPKVAIHKENAMCHFPDCWHFRECFSRNAHAKCKQVSNNLLNKILFYNTLAVYLYMLFKCLKIIEIILLATLISSWNISTYQLEIKHQNSAVAFKYVNNHR